MGTHYEQLNESERQVIDTLLVAQAIGRDLYLATRNVRDVQNSGATVFDPWRDDPAGFDVAG